MPEPAAVPSTRVEEKQSKNSAFYNSSSACENTFSSPTQRRVYGFDTETYYSKGYDIKSLGLDKYVSDDRFDCYLVSFYGPHGQFVGHPKECPWNDFDNCIWVSHNARFDRAVFNRLKRMEIVPESINPREWHDTAALAVYLQAPRSLAGASEQLLGEEPDKSIRDAMKGVDWIQAKTLLKEERILEYALRDARLSCELWLEFSDNWPVHERKLSSLTVGQGEYGIQLDTNKVQSGIQTLEKVRADAKQSLPWHGESKPTSSKALANACRDHDLPIPSSTAEDDPSCSEWEQRYGDRFPWLRSIKAWRKSNRMIKVLETMRDRCRSDGSLPFSLKYFGAIATGRWSGDAGLNLQNFNRDSLHGVDPRSCLRARPGHKLIIADLSQIEPRILAWIVADLDLLRRIETGLPIYQAHAEASMDWQGSDLKSQDPNLYLLAKCRVIGLGYGAGAKTFQLLARNYGLDLSYSEAKTTVADYREANKKVVSLWQNLEQAIRRKAGSDYIMRLPSGRYMRYFDVQIDHRDNITAATERGGRRFYWYGGKLAENLVQATARDVFAEGILRIHEAGIRILWTVHDEVICEVPENSPTTPDTVKTLLAQTPAWIPGLPVDAEAIETDHYTK